MLLLYIIRGRFPQDLILFYATHSLSIIFLFLNVVIMDDLTTSLSPFMRVCKICFATVIFMNLVIFLGLILFFILLASLIGCCPQLQQRLRARLTHYDQLIEELAQNGGIGQNFQENQPLTNEEMLELESFTLKESLVADFDSFEEVQSNDSKNCYKKLSKLASSNEIELTEWVEFTFPT